MQQNSLSSVRSKSSSTKKAGSLAAVLIVIGKEIWNGFFLWSVLFLLYHNGEPQESILCPVQLIFYHNEGVPHGSVLGPILFIFYHNDGVP